MRFNNPNHCFVDLQPEHWFNDPRVVIKAATVSAGKYNALADDFMRAGRVREVLWTNGTTKYRMDLQLFRMPSGASSITLGTFASSGGVRTFTPTKEGYALNDSGALVPNPTLAKDCAGFLITDLYRQFNGSIDDLDVFRVSSLAELDYVWLITGGYNEVAASGAVNAGDPLIASTGTAGKLEAGAAIDTSSVANFWTTLKQREFGEGLFLVSRALAVALETIGGAGLCEAEIRLPRRYAA